jgi:hypothetical protein
MLAATQPGRVLGFIRYHSGPIGGDIAVLDKVPCLLISSATDKTAPPAAAEGLWRKGRATGAPWTFAVRERAEHGEVRDLEPAAPLMTAWTVAVVRQRLGTNGSTLRDVTLVPGWLGDNRTGTIVSSDTFDGDRVQASWLPDEATARAWKALHTPIKP